MVCLSVGLLLVFMVCVWVFFGGGSYFRLRQLTNYMTSHANGPASNRNFYVQVARSHCCVGRKGKGKGGMGWEESEGRKGGRDRERTGRERWRGEERRWRGGDEREGREGGERRGVGG